MTEEEKPIHEELKELIKELEEVEPIDEKGNPFAVLPKTDLIKIKKHIEELAEEFAPQWEVRGEMNEKTSN